MILDQAKNLDIYRGLGERYAKAIDWLKSNDLEALPNGFYPIDGRDVYAMVQEYTTVPWEKQAFETHDKFSDIQYVVKGKEILTYARRGDLVPVGEYNEKTDMTIYENSVDGVHAECTDGDFMIFFPTDGHKPKTVWGEASQVKKIVIKIKAVD